MTPALPETHFELALPGPIDIPASLEPFRRWGDDLLDRWDGATLVRTVPAPGGSVPYLCTPAGTMDGPRLEVVIAEPEARAVVTRTLEATFRELPPDWTGLLRRDPVLARLDARFPGLRPVLQFDLLAALVRAISAQQVNLRWAAETRRRLARAFGEEHLVGGHTVYSLPPARLAAADPAEIRALQFTTRKAEYIITAAEAIASGDLSLEELAQLPDDDVIARLTALRGIGLWTAEWILVRVLGRPRVVAGDLGVRKAVAMAYPPSPDTHPSVSPSSASDAPLSPPGSRAHLGPSAADAPFTRTPSDSAPSPTTTRRRSVLYTPSSPTTPPVADDAPPPFSAPKSRRTPSPPPEIEVRNATAHWGTSASMAQLLLLQGLVEGTM